MPGNSYFALCRLSRRSGVRRDFQYIDLATFNGVEVEKFAQKFIKAIAGLKVEKANEKAKNFLQADE